jgi:hypothetical protein
VRQRAATVGCMRLLGSVVHCLFGRAQRLPPTSVVERAQVRARGSRPCPVAGSAAAPNAPNAAARDHRTLPRAPSTPIAATQAATACHDQVPVAERRNPGLRNVRAEPTVRPGEANSEFATLRTVPQRDPLHLLQTTATTSATSLRSARDSIRVPSSVSFQRA